MSAILIEQNKLTAGEVKDLVSHSTGSDWLFFTDEKVFSYRSDLLLRIEMGRVEVSGRCKSKILYGTQQVGSVYVRVDNPKRAFDNQVNIRCTGDLEIVLSGVQRTENDGVVEATTRVHSSLVNRRPRLTAKAFAPR